MGFSSTRALATCIQQALPGPCPTAATGPPSLPHHVSPPPPLPCLPAPPSPHPAVGQQVGAPGALLLAAASCGWCWPATAATDVSEAVCLAEQQQPQLACSPPSPSATHAASSRSRLISACVAADTPLPHLPLNPHLPTSAPILPHPPLPPHLQTVHSNDTTEAEFDANIGSVVWPEGWVAEKVPLTETVEMVPFAVVRLPACMHATAADGYTSPCACLSACWPVCCWLWWCCCCWFCCRRHRHCQAAPRTCREG